jgi:hypothetical protein
MPSTDRKLELKAKTSVAQTASQAAVYAKGLKPAGYGMHQQVEYFNNCTFCPHCIYVFCMCLRTNSDLCQLYKKKVIGFYNRDGKCLQRGMDWAFK